VPTYVASPACDKHPLWAVIRLETLFFIQLRDTLSGSRVALACELEASRFTIVRWRRRRVENRSWGEVETEVQSNYIIGSSQSTRRVNSESSLRSSNLQLVGRTLGYRLGI